VARGLGESGQCAHRRVARFDAEGPAGLIDRSSARKRRTKAGVDYVHSAVDDHSRIACCEILPDAKGYVDDALRLTL